ncbi:colicin transporter [Leisingera sp.]|uniref:colicin transporter n=1 Tax=Leisingera sp. TaxID=1879318 RepID=UPI003A93F23F
MTQIEELQGRIQAALVRISDGAAALQEARLADRQQAAEAAAEAARLAETAAANEASKVLEQELDEERLANAQLTERVRVLNARLKEAGGGRPGDAGELEALRAEVQLLRNEAGDPAEKEALRAEVARLKRELEVAANTAAGERDALKAELAELAAQNEALTAQLQQAQSGGSDHADVSAQPEDPSAALVRLDAEHQQLRQANDELRAVNAALRDANAQGVADASLINSAMEAEISGLRAAQASDKAQVNAVLAKLEPLLANARSLPAAKLPEGEEV